jgi:predicted HicB family RNase H-like nuclease
MNDDKNYGTVAGETVDDATLEAWNDAVDRRFLPEAGRPRGRPRLDQEGVSDRLQVRLGPGLRKALEDRAAASRHSRSQIVREALSEYLAPT